MNGLIRHLRYGARQLRRAPGLTAAAALTLALGIGATTAIFGLLDRAILRPLPLPHPGRLVVLAMQHSDGGVAWNFSHAAWREIAARSDLFAGVLAQAPQPLALNAGAGAERVEGEIVSANYFDVLGVAPAMGRGFLPEEGRSGAAAAVVVVGHELWRARLGGDPAILGREVMLNGRPFVIIGVAPAGLGGTVRGRRTELWIPLGAYAVLNPDSEDLDDWRASWLFAIARLARDRSRDETQGVLAGVDSGLARSGLFAAGTRTLLYPGARGLGFLVSEASRPLTLLLGAVGSVLLIACANVAGLLLARLPGRRQEIAVRLSLGAGRGRLFRQLLTEAALLAAVGGAAGLVFAGWLTDLLLAFRPPTGTALALDAGVDARLLAFAAATCLLTALVFGTAPALRACRPDVLPALNEWRAGGGSTRRSTLHGALVVGQVALCLVLLVGAGLFGRSLRNLRGVDVGFDGEGVLLASVDLDAGGYDRTRGAAFFERLLQATAALPGVEAASLASTVTPFPFGSRFDGVRLEGSAAGPEEEIGFDTNAVGPGYFETLRIPILAGRPFGPQDRAGAPRVAIVNETLARRYWPDASPVGRRILFGPDPSAPSVEIVGVAGDGKYRSLREEPTPNVYFPILQAYRPLATLIVRSGADPDALAAAVLREARGLDPELPLFDVRTLREHVALASSQDRMVTLLTELFGMAATVLALVGLYGLTAYSVAQRAREIGIRMALGARPGDVVALALGHGAWLVAGGIALGLAGALASGRLVASVLYGVSPRDPATLLAAPLALGAVALFACYLPARRATRVDPMAALRAE
jgi:predicted permease